MSGIVHLNLPRSEYDAMDRVNWSSLSRMGRSPAHYQHYKSFGRPDTQRLSLGRALHAAVLEPTIFATEYVVWDGGRRYGKSWDEFRAANTGCEIITADDRARCAEIQRAVWSHPVAGPYVRGGHSEVTVTWRHETPEIEGLPGFAFDCKARLDYVTDTAIVDLKSTRDASQDGFGRAAWRYGYHGQAAYYADGYGAATGEYLPYVLIAVEPEPPYVVQVYRVPELVLELGRQTYLAHLAMLARCEREGVWPGYSEEEQELVLPRWAVDFSDDDDLGDLGLVIGGE